MYFNNKYTKYKGLKKFNGDYYHTGNWPKNDVDFSGKRVGQMELGQLVFKLHL